MMMSGPEELNKWPIAITETNYAGDGASRLVWCELTQPDIKYSDFEQNLRRLMQRDNKPLTDPETKQHVSVRVLNPDAKGGLGVVVSPLTRPQHLQLCALLAAARPNAPLAVVEPPGFGHTDPLQTAGHMHLGYTGRFARTGRILVEALLAQGEGYLPTEYFADSRYSRYAIGMACVEGTPPVSRLAINNPPTVPLRTLLKGYITDERTASKQRAASTDPYAEPPEWLSNEFTVPRGRLATLRQLGARGIGQAIDDLRALGTYSDVSKPDTHPLQRDLELALERHPNLKVSVISPDGPNAARLAGIMSVLRFPEERFASRLSIPNTTSSFGRHHPSVLVSALLH